MIPLPNSVTRQDRCLVVKGAGSQAPPAHPMQPYYDSGAILIHHSTAGATPAGGPVAAMKNSGGAGAVFDAAVSGDPVAILGNYLQMSPSSGMPIMAYPADLIGVRLIWVMHISTYVNGTRLFGGAASSPYGFEIRLNWTTSGVIAQMWSSASGLRVIINLGPRAVWPTAPVLVEIDVGASSAACYLNGVLQGSGSHSWPMFLVENLGKGQTTGSVPMEGLMGDVLGVVTGRVDTAAAIAAARSYLNGRFSLGLAL